MRINILGISEFFLNLLSYRQIIFFAICICFLFNILFAKLDFSENKGFFVNKVSSSGEFNVELVDSNGFKLKTHSKLKSEEVTYENINGDILEKVTTTRNNLLLTSSVETNTDSVLISHNKDNQVDTIFSQGTGITTFEYNLVGLNTNVTLPNGQKQNFGYNEKNQLTNATGYGLLDFSLEYTASGQNNKLKTQREEGNLDSVQVTEFKTDEVTDLFTEKLIENQSTGIVEYENNLRIKSFTDANLNKTTIDYYINGTLKNLLTNGPKGIRNLTYTYDALGRTNSINDSQFGLFAYKYNIEGQVTEEQFGNFKNEYDYTADYNFQKHRLKKSGATISETEIQLDPDGKLQKIINGDITKEFFYVPDTFFVEKEVISKNALPVLTKIYEIDDKKRVEGIQYKNNFDFAIHHNKFNFDNLNRYIGIDEIVANKSHVFDYGNKAHLENATYTKNSSPTNYFTYQYDNIGNRKESSDNEHKTKQVYVSNNLNQYQISVVNNEVMVCGNADVDVHVTVNGMPVIRNGTEFIAYLLLPSLSALVEVVMPIQVIGVRDSVSESTEKFAKIEGNLVVHSGQASFQYDAMGHVISSDRCLYERDETGSIRVIEPKLVIATTPQLNTDFH